MKGKSSSVRPQKPVLIYDAECRFCVWSKQVLERWDRNREIRFLPFQDEEAALWVREIARPDRLDAMRLVDREGTMLEGVAALSAILPTLPLGRFLTPFFHLPGVFPLAAFLYHLLAKHRYHWFGAVRKR